MIMILIIETNNKLIKSLNPLDVTIRVTMIKNLSERRGSKSTSPYYKDDRRFKFSSILFKM